MLNMAIKKNIEATGKSGKKSRTSKAAKNVKRPVVVARTTVPKTSRKAGLGRGLDALIGRESTKTLSGTGANISVQDTAQPNTFSSQASDSKHIIMVRPEMIQASPWQPRRVFDEEALEELSDSIRAHGIIQPLICRAVKAGGYELVGGERRLRAATNIGLKEVPVIVIDAIDRDAAEIALIENLQREDLNVIEEAEGYKSLADGFNLTQADIAERVGKARASIANTMRLLELPDEVKQLLGSGLLSAGHAKVILGLEAEDERIKAASDTVREGLTVRMLEQRIARRKKTPKSTILASDIPADYLRLLLDKLHQRLGTSVRLMPSVKFSNGRRGKGKLEIDFTDNEELSRILEVIGIDVNEE